MKKYIILVFICVNFIWSGLSIAYDGLGDVEIHGFVAQGFLLSDRYDYYGIETEKGSFEYSSAGINFSSNVYTDLRVGAQFLVRDFGDLGNDQIELDWAYGDYRVNNYLGVRGGKVKVAFGLYNETRDIDSVRTSVMLPNAVYLERLRDIFAGMKGICVYGEIPGGFSYQATYGVVPFASDSYLLKDIDDSLEKNIKLATSAAVTQAALAQGIPIAAASTAGAAAASVVMIDSTESNSHNTKNFAFQWAPHFAEGLRLSGTYYGSEAETLMNVRLYNSDPASPGYTDTTTTINVDEVSSTIISAEYIFGDTILSGEYNIIKIDIDSFMGSPASTNDILGWAVTASHRFKDRFEIGMYYGDYNTNMDDRNGKDWERTTGQSRHERYLGDACLSGRIDITEGWIFKLEGHLMRGLDAITHGNDNDPTWFLFASKVSYIF